MTNEQTKTSKRKTPSAAASTRVAKRSKASSTIEGIQEHGLYGRRSEQAAGRSEFPGSKDMNHPLQPSSMLSVGEYLRISHLPADHPVPTFESQFIDLSSSQAENGRLSNLMPGKMLFHRPESPGIEAGDVYYNSVEHFYQSERFRLASLNPRISKTRAEKLAKISEEVRTTIGSLKAKELAHSNYKLITRSFQERWGKSLKIAVMRHALRQKFGRSECYWRREVGDRMQEALRATRDKYLREICKKHVDEFWGVTETTGVGQNILGRLLMEVREEVNDDRSLQQLPLERR